MTKQGRLELRHVEHLMDVCGDSHDGLMLLGTMAVVANVIKQRDAAEAALAADETIFRWLLGEEGEFPESAPRKRYGFRSELRRRLAARAPLP